MTRAFAQIFNQNERTTRYKKNNERLPSYFVSRFAGKLHFGNGISNGVEKLSHNAVNFVFECAKVQFLQYRCPTFGKRLFINRKGRRENFDLRQPNTYETFVFCSILC